MATIPIFSKMMNMRTLLTCRRFSSSAFEAKCEINVTALVITSLSRAISMVLRQRKSLITERDEGELERKAMSFDKEKSFGEISTRKR